MSEIAKQPGATFETNFDGAPTGLVGTVGVRIMDGQGNTVLARTTANIVESPPASGIYTATLTAPTAAGQYTIAWDTGGASPAYVSDTLTVSFTDPGVGFPEGTIPTVAEIGALLRARTKADGQERGTFDDDTRPTGAAVSDLILMAASYVLGRTGTTSLPDDLLPAVRYATALRTAALIEMSYWPEQAQETGSLFEMLTSTFDSHMAGLIDNLADVNIGADHRIGTIGVTSPTLAAYDDVYGIDLNEFLLG